MLRTPRARTRKSVVARNPERTRDLLLESAFRRVHETGFQATDLDSILEVAGVTKGALYHHFGSKEILGYAIIDETLSRLTYDKWLLPLESNPDPVDALAGVIRSTSLRPEDVRCGCPLNNLSQEMSPLDEGFRKRIARVFEAWTGGIAAALRKGKSRGFVRKDLDPDEEATFLVALYEGYISLAKNAQDPRVLESGKARMDRHLELLRPAGGRKKWKAST